MTTTATPAPVVKETTVTAPPITRTSAYPPAIESLLPQARSLTVESGKVPSRNRLMREFHIGAAKADALRDVLLHEEADRPDREPAPEPEALRPIIIMEDESQKYWDPGLVTAPPAPIEPHDGAAPPPPAAPVEPAAQPTPAGHPVPQSDPAPVSVVPRRVRRPVAWPVVLLALPAFVAIWSGWVELGRLTGFGVVRPLPGIADSVTLDTAITLPIGVETYAAYALYVWLAGHAPATARRFAKWSAIGSLVFGAAGQVAYHLMSAAGITAAPWQITTAVACLPVAVLGMGAALAHLLHTTDDHRKVTT